MIDGPVIGTRGYVAGVATILRSALLIWSCAMPVVEGAAVLGSAGAFDHPQLIFVGFAVHAAGWVLTMRRRTPVWTPAATWLVVALILASSVTGPGAGGRRVVLNVCISVGVAAGLVCTRKSAVVVASTVSVTVTVLLWAGPADGGVGAVTPAGTYYLLLIPVYTVCSTLAVTIMTRGLRQVAELADRRLTAPADATPGDRLRPVSPALRAMRSRILHDTVINTLGAVARGVMTSHPDAVRGRCTADIAAIDDLERLGVPDTSGLIDLVTYAGALDTEICVDSPQRLDGLLGAQPGWRRREIVGIVMESITNSAKHSGVDQVVVGVDESTARITIGDKGHGVRDVADLQRALQRRGLDALIAVDVESAPGRGTLIALTVLPLETVDGQSILTRAAAEMARRLVPVMLVEFAIIGAVATSIGTGWSVSAVLLWALTAVLLATLVARGTDGPHLSAGTIRNGYLMMLVGAVLAWASPWVSGTRDLVVPSNVSWAGDAAATVCIVLVLVDGRPRVFLPPVVLSGDRRRCADRRRSPRRVDHRGADRRRTDRGRPRRRSARTLRDGDRYRGPSPRGPEPA